MSRGALPPTWRGAGAAVVAMCLLGFSGPVGAQDRGSDFAAVPPATDPIDRKPALPRPLAPPAAAQYKKIFALQADSRWREADVEVARLADPLLLGHVLAQRYLDESRGASYEELAGWMRRFADLPDAPEIYQQALSLKPKKAEAPWPPAMPEVAPYGDTAGIAEFSQPPLRAAGAAARTAGGQWRNKVAAAIAKGNLAAADDMVSRADGLPQFDIDLARAEVAAKLFYYDERNDRAWALASQAAKQSGDRLPQAHWIAGLAAYRLGKFSEAAPHFEEAAKSRNATSWAVAAAAFWAARSHFVGGKPADVRRWFEVAADHPRTFYGQIARKILGLDIVFRWQVPVLNKGHVARLMREPQGRRALALIQIDELDLAERELRQLVNANDPDIRPALFAVAEEAKLPAVLMKAAAQTSSPEGELYDAALFPVPRWKPRDGFIVDRALIYAFVRQESGFNTRARSHAGARGLMQLMPGTAGFVSRSTFKGKKRDNLYDPELNLALGQRYLIHLLEQHSVQGDLLLLAAAYNGGPGNLGRLQDRSAQPYDPLLFVESIPVRETRLFVGRVLSNLWIYQQRLGQPTPSLEALAAGERPIYSNQDARQTARVTTRNVRN